MNLSRQISVAALLFTAACNNTPEPAPKREPVANPIIAALEARIKDFPDSIRLYDQLIDAYMKNNMYAAAASVTDQVIRKDPEQNFMYWYVKGDNYRLGEMYDSAIAAYQHYLQKFPDDEEINLNLAFSYAEAGNKLSLAKSDELAAAFPSPEMSAKAACIKGLYYSRLNQGAEARNWFDSSIRADYTFIEAWTEKGYSFYDDKMYTEAIANFKKLLNIDVSNANAWYWIAKSQEASGQTKEAIENYDKAYGLDHTITEAQQAIARLRKK